MRAVRAGRGAMPESSAARSGPPPREYLPIVRQPPSSWRRTLPGLPGEPDRLAPTVAGRYNQRGQLHAADLLVAGLLLGEELQRIEEPPVGEHLVVEMVPGGAAGGTHAADDVASLDGLARLDG